MRYFPIFVDLQGRRVVVVGGGEEATRKVRLLLKTEAKIEVIATELHAELAGNPRIYWIAKAFEPRLLDGAALVYSADKDLNATVSAAAQARGIPVNAVDEAAISTFIVPSIVDRDPVVVAIGTEGTAPVLGQGIRAKIDALLPPSLGALARRAQGLRDRVAATVPHGTRRRAFWQRFFFGEPREALESRDDVAFELSLQDAIHAEAKPATGHIATIELHAADPDLLTIKAHRLLIEADVIVADAGVAPAILELARRDAVRIHAPQEPGETLAAEAKKGLKVVHLALAQSTASTPSADIVPFPVREDLRDAILKAAS
jgi:uroporphyrin-III C-methyltransferase / precorrin-2 dehydrogenase / sirohydrochlorin ferrochelatase